MAASQLKLLFLEILHKVYIHRADHLLGLDVLLKLSVSKSSSQSRRPYIEDTKKVNAKLIH